MFTDRFPKFVKGRTLKIDMLESLRDYPRNIVEIGLQSYSDGIVTGAQIRVTGHELIVSKGLVKQGDRLLVLDQELRLPYWATDQETRIKVRIHPEEEQGDFNLCVGQVVLDEEGSLAPNELELARYKLKEGAQLRVNYRNLADFATEYNTMNFVHVLYANHGKSTLSPVITRFFASELLKHANINPLDISFAMQCLNTERVDRDLLAHYIVRRQEGLEYRPFTNGQLHKHLVRILDEIQGSERSKPGLRRGGPQRMIVD